MSIILKLRQFLLGNSDGTFRPNEKITREELTVMISRALAIVNGSSKNTEPFFDK
ncbi:S-layer homology domain-containing protein [Paenibacillus glycanilyticus]|uniref:S-layer homology domain-containing protein n=1 Tax=Paenibacillus glycanilyticus TaxID=126569 RepID=UPI0037C8FFFA